MIVMDEKILIFYTQRNMSEIFKRIDIVGDSVKFFAHSTIIRDVHRVGAISCGVDDLKKTMKDAINSQFLVLNCTRGLLEVYYHDLGNAPDLKRSIAPVQRMAMERVRDGVFRMNDMDVD
jgi:hypothetical protein